jgi:hypothetical protein
MLKVNWGLTYIYTVAFLILLTLKLTKTWDISWWIVFLPLYVSWLFMIALIALLAFISFVYYYWKIKKNRKFIKWFSSGVVAGFKEDKNG